MKAQTDLYSSCTANLTVTEAEFTKIACSQCAYPDCVRSRYSDTATQKKLTRHESLTTFVDPATVPRSPLSDLTVNRVPLTPEMDTSVDTSVQALQGKVSPAPKPASSAPAPEPVDAWAAPVTGDVDLYREYDTPEDDPWSPSYRGGMSRKISPGSTVKMRGGKDA